MTHPNTEKKMKLGKYVTLFISLVLLPLFAGCASFRAGNVPHFSSLPPTARVERKSISLKVYGAVILNGKIYQCHPTAMKKWRKQTIRAYEDSGLFSEVKEDANELDLYAEVVIVDRGDTNAFLAFITGLTLYLIPSKATDEFTLKTTIKDKDGNILGAYEKSETVTLWQHLLLVFALPFNWPASVAKEALYDLNCATIKEANAQLL